MGDMGEKEGAGNCNTLNKKDKSTIGVSDTQPGLSWKYDTS